MIAGSDTANGCASALTERSGCSASRASKARRVLGWAPTVGFKELVATMVDADLKAEQLACV